MYTKLTTQIAAVFRENMLENNNKREKRKEKKQKAIEKINEVSDKIRFSSLSLCLSLSTGCIIHFVVIKHVELDIFTTVEVYDIIISTYEGGTF